jgi:hypothetical protein
MALAGAVLLVVGFVALVRAFGLVGKCGEVFAVARASLTVLKNPALDDSAKESALQTHASRLFALFLALTAGAALALALPAGLIWLLDEIHVVSFHDVLEVALSWRFLLGSTLAGIVAWRLMRGHRD